jgi:tetratricopeptide (TPR) repeat protein
MFLPFDQQFGKLSFCCLTAPSAAFLPQATAFFPFCCPFLETTRPQSKHKLQVAFESLLILFQPSNCGKKTRHPSSFLVVGSTHKNMAYRQFTAAFGTPIQGTAANPALFSSCPFLLELLREVGWGLFLDGLLGICSIREAKAVHALSSWSSLLPTPCTLIGSSVFGDVILMDESERIILLDPSSGTVLCPGYRARDFFLTALIVMKDTFLKDSRFQILKQRIGFSNSSAGSSFTASLSRAVQVFAPVAQLVLGAPAESDESHGSTDGLQLVEFGPYVAFQAQLLSVPTLVDYLTTSELIAHAKKLVHMGNPVAALHFLQRAYEKFDETFEAVYQISFFRGYSCQLLHEHTAAIKYYSECLIAVKDRPVPHKDKPTSPVSSPLKRYLSRSGSQSSFCGDLEIVHNNMGLVYYEMCDYENAEQSFRSAIVRLPTYVRAQSNLACVLLKQGRWNDAREAARRALELDAADAVAARVVRQVDDLLIAMGET